MTKGAVLQLSPEFAMASAEQAPTIRDYLEVLRRRKWLILLFTCLVVAAAIAYTAQIPLS